MASPPDAAFVQKPPVPVISQRMRLVYPFRIGREQLGRAGELLTGGGLWAAGKVNEEFRKEMLEAASEFVFGAVRDGKPEHYYRHEASFLTTNERDSRKGPGASYRCFLNGEHGIQWLVAPSRGKKKEDKPRNETFWVDRKHGAEIFLNPFGSGVLSIALVRELPESPTWADLLEFVYHMSHIKHRPPMIWRVVPGRGELEQVEESATPAKELVETFTREGRFGNEGALQAAATPCRPFSFGRLARELLAPLVELGIRGEQGQFMVYSVIEFAGGADFEQPEYATAMRAMAQLEEASHPPVAVGAKGAVEAVGLTTRHLVAGTAMGVVHFVAQQPGNLDYNKDRGARLQVKYFASTLAAYFQLLGINGYQEAAVGLLKGLREGTAGAVEGLGKLSAEISLFTASASLESINRREAHNVFYGMLRRGFRSEAAMTSLQRTLRDMASAAEAQRQGEGLRRIGELQGQNNAILQEVKKAQEAIAETQERLHESESRVKNLELFIVLVYVAEMAHIFGVFTQASHGYSLAVATMGLVSGFLLVMLLVHSWPKWLYGRMPHRNWVRLALLALLVYLVALWLPLWVKPLQAPHGPEAQPTVEAPPIDL